MRVKIIANLIMIQHLMQAEKVERRREDYAF